MHRPSPIRAAAAAAAAALTLLAGDAGAQYAVSQMPVLTASPPTNVVVMMDDSGSMAWAFVPDAYGACTGTRRFNAGTFNTLAYSPAIVYQSPKIITNNGAQVLKTSFNAAWIDGFNQTASGTMVDLSGGYQPTASSAPGQTGQTFSPHPYQDLVAIFAPNTPPAGAANGGVGTNCGGAYSGNGGGGGGGNQFGPQTGTNTATPAPAYYYVYNASCSSTVSPPTNDDNCYVYTRVSASSAPAGAKDVDGSTIDGFQNFANWYSFYRTRHLMIASAAASAMADPVLTQARVTWRALNSCTDMVGGPSGSNPCQGWDGTTVDNRIRTFNDVPVTSGGMSQRSAFYQWLTRVPAASPTPTRSTWTYIGNYFSDTTLKGSGPYGVNPNPAGGAAAPAAELACVQNYNITLTDGQWNQDNNTAGAYFGTADDSKTTFPDGVKYQPSSKAPTAIYSNDNNSDTLSDVAFHYWSTNLRPDLPNSATAVAPYYQVTTGVNGAPTTADYWNPQNDPATWPHLVQITIGVGMTSTMNVPGLNWWGNSPATQYKLDSATNPGLVTQSPTYPNAGFDNLWYGNLAWPNIVNTAMQGDIGKAYDLWHAAVNSRGLAFSAESAADLVGALKTSMGRIKSTMAAQSAVAVSATKLSTNTDVYVASYSSQGWYGTLTAYGITSAGIGTTPVWQTGNSSFAGASTRSIFTANTAATAATASTTGVEFSASDSVFNAMWQTVAGANANNLAWLRGDTTQELQNGGTYRNRTSVLGDIIDSSPVFAWHENYGYSSLPEGMTATPNYAAFLSTKGNATGGGYQGKGMVYVGANDGMLHGFDANSGTEVFGYVPHNVIPNLPALADPAYSHQFYVDQTPYVGDACVGSSPATCTWRTVLVGTTGAGGQGVFALDVTHPELMGPGSSATGSLLFDLDGLGTVGSNPTNPQGDPDLGFPIGRPTIARLNNGDWVAVFGNGYLSSNGCAVLFMVRLFDGRVTRIGTTGTPGAGSSCTSTNINLSNGLGPVTLADVDGNMTTDYVYAGDLQGNLWKFDLHNAAAVPAGNVTGGQLLFAASPSCVPAAGSSAPNTCQPITSAPVLGPPLPGMTGTMVYFGTGRTFAVGDLTATTTQAFYAILDSGGTTTVAKSSLVQQTITDNGTTRSISGNAVVAPGWFANLPDTGERITFSPLLLDNFIVFATEVPSSNTCTASGGGWIMAVPAGSTALGANNNFFISNPGAAGISATLGMPEGMSSVYDPTTKTDKLIVGETGGPQVASTKSAHVTGRISWHELSR